LGEIDLYCANAGIARRGGPEATEADWADSWNVNVMAHVRAARLLLPAWLERGSGHLICTVSAAGLLATPGSAPYSVTKHGAVALAGWLWLTHRHRGLTVQAICPMGVRTAMFDGTDPQMEKLLGADAIMPDAVADAVMAAIADGRFLILPHPDVARMYAGRAADPDRWLAGVNKIQQPLEGTAPCPALPLPNLSLQTLAMCSQHAGASSRTCGRRRFTVIRRSIRWPEPSFGSSTRIISRSGRSRSAAALTWSAS